MSLPEEVLLRVKAMKLSWEMAQMINHEVLHPRTHRDVVIVAMHVLCMAEDIAHQLHEEIVTMRHWHLALDLLQAEEATAVQHQAQRCHQRKRQQARKAQKAARQQTRRHH